MNLQRNWGAFFFSLFLLMPVALMGGERQDVPIMISQVTAQEITDAIGDMGPEDHLRFMLEQGSGGLTNVAFPANVGGADAVFTLRNLQKVEIMRGPMATASNTTITLDGALAARPLATLDDSSIITLRDVTVRGFSASGPGGALNARSDAIVEIYDSMLAENSSGGSGGFISISGNARFFSVGNSFSQNVAAQNGGSIAAFDNAGIKVRLSRFSDGQAGGFGCDIHMESNGIVRHDSGLILGGNQFSGMCSNSHVHVPRGKSLGYANTFVTGTEGWRSVGMDRYFGNYFGMAQFPPGLLSSSGGGTIPQSICEDFGSGAFQSLGYNLSEDNSCDLDQSTDLSNADGMSAMNSDGFVVPQTGSPLIDSGSSETLAWPGNTLESLPCGYKDINGLGRPQDANNDGVFECDRGAVEVAGPGALEPGHSAAFYNLDRDGEGQYVEMLSADLALVYTFTHRPDASGSAWFIGVGNVVGNSIVIDELLRPNGTSFGNGFNSADIVNTPVGGQNMVFNDCEAGGAGGNVAFAGRRSIGYEAVLTRAQRLSDILGCGGSVTPHPNAGLSGSYFLPARDGEGIVVQWLPNGAVLVIFFTYDLNGDQQWVLGIGQSDGFSVTMDAVYASGNTRWGSDYDADDVVLTPWGTFELNWNECGGVQFGYNSVVNGYGSATREYIRLSSLWEATCPAF